MRVINPSRQPYFNNQMLIDCVWNPCFPILGKTRRNKNHARMGNILLRNMQNNKTGKINKVNLKNKYEA